MKDSDTTREHRREFLRTAGKFVVVVPPAMTFLLTTTLSSEAIATSMRGNRDGSEDADDYGGGDNCGGYRRGRSGHRGDDDCGGGSRRGRRH